MGGWTNPGVAGWSDPQASGYIVGAVTQYAGAVLPDDAHAWCDGSMLAPASYPTLFARIGTTYGGNGVTTFALPDLRGRMPIGASSGRVAGATGGAESVAVPVPEHTHTLRVGYPGSSQSINPTDNWYLTQSSVGQPSAAIYSQTDQAGHAAVNGINTAGTSGATVSTLPPYLAIGYIICIK